MGVHEVSVPARRTEEQVVPGESRFRRLLLPPAGGIGGGPWVDVMAEGAGGSLHQG